MRFPSGVVTNSIHSSKEEGFINEQLNRMSSPRIPATFTGVILKFCHAEANSYLTVR